MTNELTAPGSRADQSGRPSTIATTSIIGGDTCERDVFFFSSRRRHTRLQGDWSSDVCSSDLALLKNADIAMYRAKQQGKNTAQHYASGMNPGSVERLELEAALRHALERNELDQIGRAHV